MECTQSDSSQEIVISTGCEPDVVVISSDSDSDDMHVSYLEFLDPGQASLKKRLSSDVVALVYDEIVASVLNVFPDADTHVIMSYVDEFSAVCSSREEIVNKVCDCFLQNAVPDKISSFPNSDSQVQDTSLSVNRINNLIANDCRFSKSNVRVNESNLMLLQSTSKTQSVDRKSFCEEQHVKKVNCCLVDDVHTKVHVAEISGVVQKIENHANTVDNGESLQEKYDITAEKCAHNSIGDQNNNVTLISKLMNVPKGIEKKVKGDICAYVSCSNDAQNIAPLNQNLEISNVSKLLQNDLHLVLHNEPKTCVLDIGNYRISVEYKDVNNLDNPSNNCSILCNPSTTCTNVPVEQYHEDSATSQNPETNCTPSNSRIEQIGFYNQPTSEHNPLLLVHQKEIIDHDRDETLQRNTSLTELSLNNVAVQNNKLEQDESRCIINKTCEQEGNGKNGRSFKSRIRRFHTRLSNNGAVKEHASQGFHVDSSASSSIVSSLPSQILSIEVSPTAKCAHLSQVSSTVNPQNSMAPNRKRTLPPLFDKDPSKARSCLKQCLLDSTSVITEQLNFSENAFENCSPSTSGIQVGNCSPSTSGIQVENCSPSTSGIQVENCSPSTSGTQEVMLECEQSCANYECKCCYNDVSFEELVQCSEGHLFCRECLRRYTQESVYGGGKATLICMSDGCTANFPQSQLQRALPEDLYCRYEERVQEEFISLANLKNFVRCIYCNFGAELDEEQQVFTCPNDECKKQFCRRCNKDWDDHAGLKCNEVEKEDETKIRLEL